jgi:4-hydroxybenzoate polyprenyltransferase
MEERFQRRVLSVTISLLVAAALVIPLGFVGLTPGVLLTLLLFAIAGALFVVRDRLREYGLPDALWVGAVIGGLVMLAGTLIDASPGELQTLGGLVGLLGVANSLLRPIYELAYAGVQRLRQSGSDTGS